MRYWGYSIYRDPSSENLASCANREVNKFSGKFRGKYWRLQTDGDHSQPPNELAEIAMLHQPPTGWQAKHTADVVNAAVTGAVPWVRVNPLDPAGTTDTTYEAQNRPVYLPGELAATNRGPSVLFWR